MIKVIFFCNKSFLFEIGRDYIYSRRSERFGAQSHLRLIKFMNLEYYIIRNFQLYQSLRCSLLYYQIINLKKNICLLIFAFIYFSIVQQFEFIFRAQKVSRSSYQIRLLTPNNLHRSKSPALTEISLRIFGSIRIVILVDGSKAL